MTRTGVTDSDMRLPLIVVEGHDVSTYWSVYEAENALEAIDVRNGEYSGYDIDGRQLAITATSGNRVTIRLAETTPTHSDRLIHALRGYALACGRSVPPEISASQLIELIYRRKVD